jgi:LacI family transcriptional regulator
MSVSRVINGTRKVSPETERKVLAAVRRIGYVPNDAARILKGQRSSVVGLIVPDLADPFFATCAQAVQQATRRAGYLTWMAASDHREDVERELTQAMTQRSVAGLLVIPSGLRNDHFAVAAETGIPIVSLDRPLQHVAADAVVVDNRAAAARATEHLIQHGHSSIVCITDDESIFTKTERIAGYSQAMSKAKLQVQVWSVGPISGPLSERLTFALQKADRPTAIFAESNLVAVEALHELQKRGIRIPERMALIVFDDFDAANLVRPAITVIRQPIAEIGKRAAEILCNRLKGTYTAAVSTIVLPTELVVRQSCGCGSRLRKSPKS